MQRLASLFKRPSFPFSYLHCQPSVRFTRFPAPFRPISNATGSGTESSSEPKTQSETDDKAEKQREFAMYIMRCIPKFIQRFEIYKDELTLHVAPDHVVPTMLYLRDHTNTQFRQVMDICGVDYPGREYRFDVVYNMLSLRYNSRIRVKTYASESSVVPSITPYFPAANWFEREAYDMYGIFFSGHPDLRRILTDYGFEGHPMRKDFPLSGFVEVRYDNSKRRVVLQPVELAQAFRNFDYRSPWDQVGEGTFEKKSPESEQKK